MKRKKLHRFGPAARGDVFKCADCGVERRFAWHGASLLGVITLYRAPKTLFPWTTENPQCRK